MSSIEPETGEFEGESFQVLYTGMRDGRVLEDLVDDNLVSREGGNEKLYFTASKFQAFEDYINRRRIPEGSRPIVLETWFPEDMDLEEWSSGLEYVTDSYDVRSIRGYTDVGTGEYVYHGSGWQPEGLLDSAKARLGLIEEPSYFFPEDTEFDPSI